MFMFKKILGILIIFSIGTTMLWTSGKTFYFVDYIALFAVVIGIAALMALGVFLAMSEKKQKGG
ncbi:MAG: hypothetical protein BMS9Abin13_063 [Patescibacteria group bacterium]|nr:MAG: hypothetical protein BMS9Abin13_063 [Patescibacteria group bacterium]